MKRNTAPESYNIVVVINVFVYHPPENNNKACTFLTSPGHGICYISTNVLLLSAKQTTI